MLFTVEPPALSDFDPARCVVRPVGYDAVREVVAEAHYIGRPGSTSVALGIFAGGVLGGVITYGTIPKPNAIAICGPEHSSSVMELTRLALYDWLPSNSESWLIAQSFGWLRENRPDVSVLISYADQSRGHAGAIYQATNWIYTGASTGDVVYRMPDGSTLHPRTVGWVDLPPGGKWEPSPGKHRYVTFLGSKTQRRALRRALRWPSLPYPKASP